MITSGEQPRVSRHSRELIENHCLFDEDSYFIPEYGFKLVDLVIYLNHSDTPNVISINDGERFEAIRDIAVGEEFTKDNIWVKRPGTGDILAEEYESLLGKKSLNNIKNDTFLEWKDIKN